MRKNITENQTWEFNNEKFKASDFTLNDELQKNNIYPIVWYKGKLYKAFIKPQIRNRIDKVCLFFIYNQTKKPYWTTVDKVYQIIKL